MIRDRDFLPPHLQKSTVVLKVQYGDVNHSESHTAYIGEVTFNYIPQMGYLWLKLGDRPSWAVLRHAKRIWPILRRFFSPVLFAHAEPPVDTKFLSHFGFSFLLEEDGMQYFKETPNVI